MTTFIIEKLNNCFVWLKRRYSFVFSPFAFIKTLSFKGEKFITTIVMAGIIASESVFGAIIPQTKAEFKSIPDNFSSLATIQGNSLLAVSDLPQPVLIKELPMLITAYSSTVWETDETPFITASGSMVKDGIVANNILPFGTKIRIPELYGDKIFVVEDRMHWSRSDYQLDIWFPENWQAKNFGAKRTYVEILEN